MNHGIGNFNFHLEFEATELHLVAGCRDFFCSCVIVDKSVVIIVEREGDFRNFQSRNIAYTDNLPQWVGDKRLMDEFIAQSGRQKIYAAGGGVRIARRNRFQHRPHIVRDLSL